MSAEYNVLFTIPVIRKLLIIMSDGADSLLKIGFKKKKSKPVRKRHYSDDSTDDETSSKLEDLKIIQKLRARPRGVNIVGLALGETLPTSQMITLNPFNIETSLANTFKITSSKTDDAYNSGIGTQFNAETNKRDEDEEMVKYIEGELSKRKNQSKSDKDDELSSNKTIYYSPEEAALWAVPEYLRQGSSHKNEEMLSNQMLSGIPEVDLGIEAKIRNIEATEEAKLKLLWERHKKKDGPSQFVPTNMAVNFVQHNRFNIEDPDVQKGKQNMLAEKKTKQPKEKRKDSEEKATDDYHYERFKKQFRRF